MPILLLVMSAAGCVAKPVDMAARRCDAAGACSPGFACDVATDTCVPVAGEACDSVDIACGIDVGSCRRGLYSCIHGVWSECSGQLPTREVCNGLDDDCDGFTDEENVDNDGDGYGNCDPVLARRDCDDSDPDVHPEGTELCNDVDDDCDGLTDEVFPEQQSQCSVGVGARARTAIWACVDGALDCPAQPGTPVAEVCDGLDNDCDGDVNEDFPTLGQPCSAGVGGCTAYGTFVCQGAASVACSAQPKPAAVEETACDGIDEDCNGVVDDVHIACDGEDSDLELDDEGRCVTGGFRCTGWWNRAYHRRIKLVFKNTSLSEDEADVPVLVTLDDTRVDPEWLDRSDGSDIRFVAGDDDIALPAALDQWSAGRLWVLVPSMTKSSSHEFIYMYYDNPAPTDDPPAGPVWDAVGASSSYRGVWHLGSDTADDRLDDATSLHHDCMSVAAGKDADATAWIGNGRSFDADGTGGIYVPNDAAGHHSDLQISGAITVSFWLNYASLRASATNTSPNQILGFCGPSSDAGDNCQYWIWLEGDSKLAFEWQYTHNDVKRVDVVSTVPIGTSANSWHHYVAVRSVSPKEVRFYVDGTQLGDAISYSNDADGGGTSFLYVGTGGDGLNGGINGILDELQIMATAHDAAWVNLQYRSMAGLLIDYQPEELVPPD